MRKILAVEWFTQGQAPHHFGIVITENEVGEKKAYIGIADGLEVSTDIQSIADWGCKIYPEQLEKLLSTLSKGVNARPSS